MDIQPIKTEVDYDRALAEISALRGAEPATTDGDRLDILMVLVEAHEIRHYPIDPHDPVDAILFRMVQKGLPRKDQEPILGSHSRVSKVLNRKRSL